jgi:Tfp pilus assembly protein PilP
MSAKKAAGIFLIISLGVMSAPAGAEEKAAARSGVQKVLKPLVRTEWLQKKSGPAAPVKRDIFSPQGASGSDAITPIEAPEKAAESRKAKVEAESVAVSFNLRYVGYIQSKQKVVGLILLDGQALAVEEGDSVGQGFKILKISAKEMEVEEPSGKLVTLALEGGQK